MEATITKRRPRVGKKEFHTSEVTPEQLPPIIDRGDRDDDSLLPKVHAVDKAKHPNLTKDYYDALKFMEEPVTVMFTSGSDRNAPKFVDCAVNGRGLEAMVGGKWLEVFQVPTNMKVTIKRKFVEVFARCKHTDIVAKSHGPTRDGSPPVNETIPTTNLKHPFNVLHDPSGEKGHDWLTRIIMGRA